MAWFSAKGPLNYEFCVKSPENKVTSWDEGCAGRWAFEILPNDKCGSRKVINITIISDLHRTYLFVFLEVTQTRERLAAELATVSAVGRWQRLQVLQFALVVEECGVCGVIKLKQMTCSSFLRSAGWQTRQLTPRKCHKVKLFDCMNLPSDLMESFIDEIGVTTPSDNDVE